MNRFHLFALCACLSGYSLAQTLQPLAFNKEGKFKIVQFTDVHMKFGNPASDIALERIDEVVKAERPDLVVFTGDVIFGAPANQSMQAVLSQVAKHKVPFVVTFGNHDDEHALSRQQLYDVIKEIPYNLTPDYRTDIDFVLPIKASNRTCNAALVYGFDSHAYTQMEEAKGYAWITFEQIDRYLKKSAQFTACNGNIPLPALAFFHIPLPEFSEAAASETAVMIGTRMEKSCPPKLNSGMFTAMKQAGDVMGVFVGHDHDNDYAVMWKGIVLAYGRYTGGDTVYNHLPNGARVIELKEGSRTFTSWIRSANSPQENRVSYPDSFIKK